MPKLLSLGDMVTDRSQSGRYDPMVYRIKSFLPATDRAVCQEVGTWRAGRWAEMSRSRSETHRDLKNLVAFDG